MNQIIYVTRYSMPPDGEFCEDIRELWNSCWLTNMGRKHEKFRRELEVYLGAEHVTLYTNGHLALENAIKAMGLPEGSEVITTPFTFASTTHAIVRNHLKPVFCDINAEDYTIDVTKLESLITEQTSAIVPVHVYGNLCDVEEIGRIAGRYGLKVVYDAAHAFGVECKGKNAACFGDAAMFSFHATKVFHTIEGGAVCYRDGSLVQMLDDMKNFGIRGPETCEYVGGNAKMSEFQAAMGLCNLRYIENEIGKRKRIYERYMELLSGREGLRLNRVREDIRPNYAYFPVVFDGYALTRDEVQERLSREGILARKYFYPLTSDLECYRSCEWADAESTPVAQRIAQQVLALPMYADLTEHMIEKICEIILHVR